MNQNEQLYDQSLDWFAIGRSPDTVQSYRWGLKSLSTGAMAPRKTWLTSKSMTLLNMNCIFQKQEK